MRLTDKELEIVAGQVPEKDFLTMEPFLPRLYKAIQANEDAKDREEVDGVLGQDVPDEFYAWAEPNAAKLVPMTKTKSAALAFKAGQESRMVGLVGECKTDRRAELLTLAGQLAVAWMGSGEVAMGNEAQTWGPAFVARARAIIAAVDVSLDGSDADLLLESNELLRSFASIIGRKGIETNWAALENAVGDALRRQHQRTNELRAAKA